MAMIEADTCQYASVYEGSDAVARPGNTHNQPDSPVYRAENLEKRRGAGRVFPSLFKPSSPTASPTELFPPTASASENRSLRFISRNDRTKVLVFTDGTCPNNGQLQPRAGWAVVCGPAQSDVVADRLEGKGPFGDDSVQTSNHAELRAVISTLRLRDWKDDGFGGIVVATDSAYVTDGATNWARGWVRNGWRTRSGGDVKNRDFW